MQACGISCQGICSSILLLVREEKEKRLEETLREVVS